MFEVGLHMQFIFFFSHILTSSTVLIMILI